MQPQIIRKEAEQYLAEFRKKTDLLTTQAVTHYAQHALSLFFTYFQLTGAPLREAVELLCEINASPNSQHSQAGLEALFPHLIEKLNDAFLPTYCNLYDRLFAQVISFFRRLPEGQSLDTALNSFKLSTEAEILARKRTIEHHTNRLSLSRPLKKIIFLSRITIGADVAVTSVFLAGLRSLFPSAELVLLGSEKLQQLYQGTSNLRVAPIYYGRQGTLLARLESWEQVVLSISREIAGLDPQEFCIIDPDSRLTQLGLLPTLESQVEAQSYFFFPSRRYSTPNHEKLGQLASHWLDYICDTTISALPFIALNKEQERLGQDIVLSFREASTAPVICLNFGVGGNSVKRVSEQFETDLVAALAKTNKLIIDCGITPEEYQQVKQILAGDAVKNKVILPINDCINPSTLPINSHKADILIWQGGLGAFASIIAASDLYLGYDSAGQHIAAALNVPTLTIFVNSGSHFFPLRWQPYGLGAISTIHTSPLQVSNPRPITSKLLAQVLTAYKELLNQ